MDRQNLFHWLALKRIPGLGPVGRVRLLRRFKTPERIFQADPLELETVEGLRKTSLQALIHFQGREQVERELDQLEQKGIEVLTLQDPRYPPLLAQIPDPPLFLYYQGNPSERDRASLAVVGSRMGTPYGLKITERLARGLAQSGLTVVSGLALGIDAAAHWGALSGGGRTVAVLGSGLDVLYPKENAKLFHRLREVGMVCSEFPPGTLPERQNFPIRNRIISGMSLGVVVVEAGQSSGSLITARLALDQGREVFAVPGSIDSYKSTGTNQLIKQGAKLVEHVRDILEEISRPGLERQEVPEFEPQPDNLDLTEEERPIWEALGDRTLHVDELVRATGIPTATLLGLLLGLELKGCVRQLPGKFFTRS